MNYSIGETGRIVVARFEDGDQIIQGITEIVKKENIRAGVYYLLGGMKSGKFVVDLKPMQCLLCLSGEN